MSNQTAKYQIGQIVKHKYYPFRGVVFDVDAEFSNSEQWWQSIPEDIRPHKNQPFYHLLAENAENTYVAYVSEQNLEPDNNPEPISHPQVEELFDNMEDGVYHQRYIKSH